MKYAVVKDINSKLKSLLKQKKINGRARDLIMAKLNTVEEFKKMHPLGFSQWCMTRNLFRFYSFSNLKNLRTGEEFDITDVKKLAKGVNFLQFEHDGRLYLVKSVDQEHMTYCPFHKRYYLTECGRCLSKYAIREVDKEIPEEEAALRIYSVVEPPDLEREEGLYIICHYDLETITTATNALYPMMVCVLFEVKMYTKDMGTVSISNEGISNVLFSFVMDNIQQMWEQNGFTFSESGFSTADLTTRRLCHMYFSPDDVGEVLTNTIAKNFVRAQDFTFEWLRIPEIRQTIRQLSGVIYKYHPSRFAFVSSAFNGSKFDELFMLNFRLYQHGVFQKWTYVVKNGALYKMNRLERVDDKQTVLFILFDCCRFFTMSLRVAQKSCKLDVEKGDVDFDMINDIYKGCLDCDWRDLKDKDFNKYPKYFGVDGNPTELLIAVKQMAYQKGPKVNLCEVVLDYCYKDVMVLSKISNVMQDRIDEITVHLLQTKLCIFTRIGIPAVTRMIQNIYFSQQNTIMYSPQNDALELISQTIYGGRSEVLVIGMFTRLIKFFDINSMYASCMKAPFPFGPPMIPTEDIVNEFQRMFDAAIIRGWASSFEDFYAEDTTDLGFLFFWGHLQAPNRHKLRRFAPLPYRSKQGLVWSNESRIQQLNSLDAINLSRCGWKVTILRSRPMFVYRETGFLIRDLVDYYSTQRKLTKDEAMKIVYKLLSNALYGKFLEKVQTGKMEFCKWDQYWKEAKKLPYVGKYLDPDRDEYGHQRTCEQIFTTNYIAPIPNPYEEDAEIDELAGCISDHLVNVVNYDVHAVDGTNNQTLNHIGSAVLSYSRMQFLFWMELCRGANQEEKDLEDQDIPYTASETDSAHLLADFADRMPEILVSDTEVGNWIAEKKMLTCYLKLEGFPDGTPIVAGKEMLIAKKFYAIEHPKGGKPKIASKGMSKAEMNWEVVLSCLKGVYYDPTDGMIKYEQNIDPVMINAKTLKRALPGVRVTGETSEQPLTSVVLKRRLKPSFNTKRIHPKHTSCVYLEHECLELLPYDDLNVNPFRDFSDGLYVTCNQIEEDEIGCDLEDCQANVGFGTDSDTYLKSSADTILEDVWA